MKKVMKILCVLGFHKPSKYVHLRVTGRHKNGKKYHRHYEICARCWKKLGPWRKAREE